MNRRQFVITTSAAAAGFAALGSSGAVAALPEQPRLVDVNVSLGRWPFRRLPLDQTSKLVAKLRAHGVTQAWAGSFDAAFGKDLRAANAQLADDCRKHGRGLLLPFGTVNLTLPNWEDEFRRCVEIHHMPGLRLFPGYHAYKLGDAAVGRLFTLVAEKKLVLQIATDLEDERTQPVKATAPHLDAKPLLPLLKDQPNARMVLLNWHRSVKTELVQELAAAGVGFDIATVENVGGVANLVGRISSERVLFGSHAPFFYFESAQLKLRESALDDRVLDAITTANARRLLSSA